jgi:hypothetical protein
MIVPAWALGEHKRPTGQPNLRTRAQGLTRLISQSLLRVRFFLLTIFATSRFPRSKHGSDKPESVIHDGMESCSEVHHDDTSICG